MDVGFGKEEIIYRDNIDLIGYKDRKTGAKGIHDKLYVKCLRLGELYFITCDLLALSSDVCERVKKQIDGIRKESIIISCTHTHSAPAAMYVKTVKSFDASFLFQIEQKLIKVVQYAKNNTLNLNIVTAHEKISEISYNRVIYKIYHEKIFIDNSIKLMCFFNEIDKKIRYIVVNFACHPVCLGSDNLLYSNDYIYYLEEYIKEYWGKEVDIIFWNGCCGNLNPYSYGNFEIAKEIGEKIGLKIIQAIEKELILSTKRNTYNYFCNFSSYLKVAFEHNIDNTFFEQIQGVDLQNKKWIEKIKKDTIDKEIYALVKCMWWEDLVIISLPFEVFNEIEHKIEFLFPNKIVFIICYADGVFGYLFTHDYYKVDMYENKRAHIFYGMPDVFSSRLVGQLLKIIDKFNRIQRLIETRV